MPFIAAQATADHARKFYELAQMAGADLFTRLFGARAAAALESMVLRKDNAFRVVHTRFLIQDDAIAGMLPAYPARVAEAQEWRSLWLMLRLAKPLGPGA